MGSLSIIGKINLILIVLLLSISIVLMPASAVKPEHTPDLPKIVPTKGAQAGHPFTIIDTPEARLYDGTKAVFRSGSDEITVDLWTHRPYTTARGVVPELGGGEYTVYFVQPDGTEVEVGPFGVTGHNPDEASISPASGPPGTPFTITDPQGRMKNANRMIITPEGMTPVEGLRLIYTWFSIDGTTATGKIPLNLMAGNYYITVHEGPPATEPPVFDALLFIVT